MYTLSEYVDVLMESVMREKDKEKRSLVVKAWVAMMKRHHRDSEGKKILELLEGKIEDQKENVQVSVSDEREKEKLNHYFAKKDLNVEWEINSELLGGAKIVWNNVLIDNTISRQLDKLKEKVNRRK